jgi:hypothetical protein
VPRRSNPHPPPHQHGEAKPLQQHPQTGLWLISSDWQVPYHSEEALAVFFAAVKALQPVGVILAGDILDCRTLSHFTKDPMDPRSLADEIRIVRELVAELAPVPIKVFEEGNHERRLVNYLHSKTLELACLPELELPNLLRSQETGWLYLSYGQPYELGDALVVHGSKVA